MTIARLAAAQFATNCDVADNLATTLRMIDAASRETPDVVVLPEFCNHLSVYDSFEHAHSVAIDLDGEWVDRIGAAAARHRMWVQVNCTVRRGASRITNTNLLFDRNGRLRAANDKTVLMGAEGIHLSPADDAAELVVADIGGRDVVVGTYACMDGVVPEVPRSLAVRGARLLLNSLNSFALDEASTHIPVRAAENRAWLVACCKIGPLLPPDRLAEFSENMGVPGSMLRGAGESQIVRPDGVVVAKGPRDEECVVCADADLSLSGLPRPDGTNLLAERRPRIYAPLFAPTPADDDHPRAESLRVAAARSIDDVHAAIADGARLVVTTELGDVDALARATRDADVVIVTSTRFDSSAGATHCGIVIDRNGVVHHQRQLHRTNRHPWVESLGDELITVDMPWGRLAMIVGDDILYPEIARLAALRHCDVIAVPWSTGGESWDLSLCLPERSAENRVCLVATGPSSVVIDLPPDFTLWAPERTRPFDGTINQPDVFSDENKMVVDIHPVRSLNRRISRNTDLVDGRPWQLCGALVE